MTTPPKIDAAVRHAILSQPDAFLDDKDVMRALIAANERSMGENIIDLRGIAMDRLETRLDRLENTHRSVVAAAYENVAGTNQIHRAVLRMLDATSFEGFLEILQKDVTETLRVDALRLVIESGQTADGTPPDGDVLCVRPQGFVEAYVTRGRAGAPRQATLRTTQPGDDDVFGPQAQDIPSEACLTLDLGPDRLPGLLVLGAKDPQMFDPQQGTDLLVFLAEACERMLRRWLP